MAEVYLRAIEEDIGERRITDRIIPIWQPLLPYIVASLFALMMLIDIILMSLFPKYIPPYSVFILAVFAIFLIPFSIWYLYMLYKLIKRRNEHFKRQRKLLADIVSYLREIAKKRGIDISVQLAFLERSLREAELEEEPRSPILWVLLILAVSFVIFYVYHFLTKDYYVHEKREDVILERLNDVLRALGLPTLTYKRDIPIPRRNTILYVVLTIVTLGIFSAYWTYVITKDPNNHFKEHAKWEDELIKILKESLTI